jgi:hypothetical protein
VAAFDGWRSGAIGNDNGWSFDGLLLTAQLATISNSNGNNVGTSAIDNSGLTIVFFFLVAFVNQRCTNNWQRLTAVNADELNDNQRAVNSTVLAH